MNARTSPDRRAELVGARRPFVQATVVRAEQPTSARPGDVALVLDDGRFEGFVGGQCTTTSVRTAALEALADGHSVLLRVLPDGAPDFPETPGARVMVNPCLSGGSVEIYLEPVLPAPVVHVAGASPIARAVAQLAPQIGYDVTDDDDSGTAAGATAVVVARHGGAEPADIRAALDAGAAYIGLVASPVRGAAVLDELDLTDDERARVHTPAGIDIGAVTPEEIALSILAQMVEVLRREHVAAPARPALPIVEAGPELAVDPVCGMSVVVDDDAITLRVHGDDYYFCRTGCRDAFAAEHGVATGG